MCSLKRKYYLIDGERFWMVIVMEIISDNKTFINGVSEWYIL